MSLERIISENFSFELELCSSLTMLERDQDCRDTFMLCVIISACTVLSSSACFWAVDIRWSSNVQLLLTFVSVNTRYTRFKMNWCVSSIVIFYYLGGKSFRSSLVRRKFLWLGAESQLLFDVSNGVLNTEQDIPRGYSSAAEPTNIISNGKLCDPNVQQYRWLHPPH